MEWISELISIKPSAASAYGIWVLVIAALITIYKGWPSIVHANAESGGSLRKDLLTRIEGLEDDLRAERKSCEEQMRILRQEITGMHRQLIAFQISSGRPLHINTPESDAAIDRLIECLDKNP